MTQKKPEIVLIRETLSEFKNRFDKLEKRLNNLEKSPGEQNKTPSSIEETLPSSSINVKNLEISNIRSKLTNLEKDLSSHSHTNSGGIDKRKHLPYGYIIAIGAIILLANIVISWNYSQVAQKTSDERLGSKATQITNTTNDKIKELNEKIDGLRK